MKTMKVNLNVLQSVTSQHSIVETDTQFQLPVSLGGGDFSADLPEGAAC